MPEGARHYLRTSPTQRRCRSWRHGQAGNVTGNKQPSSFPEAVLPERAEECHRSSGAVGCTVLRITPNLLGFAAVPPKGKQMKVLMETEQVAFKYKLRCKALENAYGYLHKSMKGATHLNARRAANFIERVEIWLDQHAPVPVTPWIAAAAHSDYSGGGGMTFKETRPLADPEINTDLDKDDGRH